MEQWGNPIRILTLLIATALLVAPSAFAQHYPSSTFLNVSVMGAATFDGVIAGTPTVTAILQTTPSGSSAPSGNNTPTLDFLQGRINIQNQVTSGNTYNAGFLAALTQASSGYTPGNGVDPVMQIYAKTAPGSTGAVMGPLVTLYSYASPGNGANLDQGIGVLAHKGGQNSTWQFSGATFDESGYAPQSGTLNIGAELDDYATGADPVGSRILLYLVPKLLTTPAWQANTYYAVGTTLTAESGSTYNVYVTTVAGTTAATPPTWPSSGTVTNGGATFAFGNTYSMVQSYGIYAAGNSGVSYGSIFATNGQYSGAAIDLTGAVASGSSAAAIRIAPNQIIDLAAASGNYNTRVLAYTSSGREFFYNIGNATAFSVTDAFQVGMPGVVNLAYGTQSEINGVTTGFPSPGLSLGGNALTTGDADIIYPYTGGLQWFYNFSGTRSTTPQMSLDGSGDLALAGGLTVGGHQISTQTTAPTVAQSGGSGSTTLNSQATDAKGTLTEGTSATGAIVTFHAAYATAPDCVVSSPTGTTLTNYTAAATTLTIVNPATTGAKFTYHCIQ